MGARKTSELWGPYWTSPALDVLAAEADHAWPHRKRPDGTIGDKHHKPPSGHLPDAEDMVRARDFWTSGLDAQTLVHTLITDDRTDYVIYQSVIWDRDLHFRPVAYHGTPHPTHVHAQVLGGAHGRDTRPWGLWTPDKHDPPGGIFPGGRVLRLTVPPYRGADVQYVQRYIGVRRCGAPDGVYGAHTARGVRWYQGMRGLRVDGIVGPVTWRSLLGR